jgi:carbamoylphosphate synthase large subunit
MVRNLSLKRKVLVTGIGGPAGKSAVAYFSEKGFTVIGTDVRGVDIKTDEFSLVPLAADPSYAGVLLEMIRVKEPVLLVPTVTEELLVVAKLKKEIEALGCALFISPPEAVEIANDKLKTCRFMEKNGIPVPAAFDDLTPRDAIAKELGFPFLSKPCFGRGGRGVKLYGSLEEARLDKREGLVFQEFIPGDEFDVNLFIDSGVVRASAALKKTVLKEGVVGNAVSVERASNREVVELAVDAARALGMEGPLDFDIRLRDDKTPALLEINARLGGNVLHAREVLDAMLTSLEKGFECA